MEEESGKKRKGKPQQREQIKKSVATSGSIELDALDCTVCMEPLKPRVFQCTVGHVICSSCHGKLPNKDMCGVCSTTTGYNRCFAIEHILELVRVRCSNSMYGCTAVTRYHEREEHEKSCPHTPCFCPEAGCGFAGSTPMLLHHLTTEHKWPSTELRYNVKFTLQVQEGMHVLHSRDGRLFLVKFTPAPPFGSAASVLCVDPHAVESAVSKFRCHLGFSCLAMGWQQSSDFQVRSTALSDGSLTEDGSCPFVVPNVSSNPATNSSINVSIVKIMRDNRGNEIQLSTERPRQRLLTDYAS